MIPQTNQNIQPNQAVQNLYDRDYCLWIDTTVKQLQAGQLEAVDWKNLIEEVADLSRRERDKLISLLTRLFEHLLKLTYWEAEREYNANKWKSEIRNFRKQINKLLNTSPSLKPFLVQIFDETYLDARDIIIDLTGLSQETFPVTPIANVDEALNENWIPGMI